MSFKTKIYLSHITILIPLLVLGSVITNAQEPSGCAVQLFEVLELPAEAGDLLYWLSDQDRSDQTPDVRSLSGQFVPQIAQHSHLYISPNGEYILSTFPGGTIVFDRRGQVIYRGAAFTGPLPNGGLNWLGNDQVWQINLVPRGRTSTLRTSFDTSYFIIDPFARSYEIFRPVSGSFFKDTYGEAFQRYTSVFDGRYVINHRGVFDMVMQEWIMDYENLIGVYNDAVSSSTSYRFLSVQGLPIAVPQRYEAAPYPILIYDLTSDVLIEVATIMLEGHVRPRDHSWSPDERLWVYVEDFGDEISPIKIFNLASGQSTTTCFERSGGGVWSRDSRYLAVRAILRGQAHDTPPSLYIYDTQTEAIYWVQDGVSSVVGWVAND